MLKTSGNGTQASGATKFTLRPTAETLADLSHPIDPRHLKTRKQGTTTLTYCPWNTIARHLPPSDPLSAPLGQVFALGDQTLMDRTGEHRHAVPAHLVAEVLAGDADSARAGTGDSSGVPVSPPRPLGQAIPALTGTRAGRTQDRDAIPA